MNIAPVTTIPVDRAPTPRPAFANVFLGRLVDVHAPKRSQMRVMTGDTAVGPVRGWASLNEARAAVAELTKGAAPAAAILMSGNHFVAQTLVQKTRSLSEDGTWSDWKITPLDLIEGGAINDYAFRPYRTTPIARTLEAIIDGPRELTVTPAKH